MGRRTAPKGITVYGTMRTDTKRFVCSKKNSALVPVDEIKTTHVGCEYGEYGDPVL